MASDEFTPVEPHGAIEPAFTDVHIVSGTVRMMPLMRITRTMTIVRVGDELTLINAVRLDDAGEAALAKLGKVAHVLRIGTHAMDDRYYQRRHGARYWALPGMRHAEGLKPDAELRPDAELPIPDA
ncbi:MAG: hypothetical protein KC431_09035, partial [Myxococcales bacterium]|nr:hypothetical protein [Myxococcales bacterium]